MSKKFSIDGPAGRNHVSDEYRENYDMIFRRSVSLYFGGERILKTIPGGFKTFPKKSQKGGGKNAKTI